MPKKPGSVSTAIFNLKEAGKRKGSAEKKIFEHSSPGLEAVSARRFRDFTPVDPHQPAQSVIRNVMADIHEGVLPGVEDREHLRAILLRRFSDKANDEFRKANAKKRPPQNERQDFEVAERTAADAADSGSGSLMMREFLKSCTLEEQLAWAYKEIGFSRKEISEMMGCSERTIDTRWKTLRDRALTHFKPSPAPPGKGWFRDAESQYESANKIVSTESTASPNPRPTTPPPHATLSPGTRNHAAATTKTSERCAK